MDTLATTVLIVLGLAAFTNYREGTLGDWLRAKFLNAADPPPAHRPPADQPKSGPTPPIHDVAYSAAGKLSPPLTGGRLTGTFGEGRGDHRHAGVDWAVPIGTPVRSAQRGRVTYAGSMSGYGLVVDVDHGGGLMTRYAHLNRIGVDRGQLVELGAPVGESGNTGRSTGPHLHFEVRRNGAAIDPMRVIVPATLGGSSGGWS